MRKGTRIALVVTAVVLVVVGAGSALGYYYGDVLPNRAIEGAQKVARDHGWEPTGGWASAVSQVSGQVKLGTCVQNVAGPANSPEALQVFLPNPNAAQDGRSTIPFLVTELRMEQVRDRANDYRVATCFL